MLARQVQDRYALAAARLLVGQPQQRDDLLLSHDRQRHAVIDAMALAIANRTRRKWVACAGALTLAAASVTLALGSRARSSRALVVGHVGGQGTAFLPMDTAQSLSASQTLVPGDVIEVSDEPPSDTADGEPAVAPGPTDASANSTVGSSSTSRPVIAPYAEHSEIAVPDADTIVRPVEESRLAEQNDLFSAAMAAEWRGQYAAALRKLDELIFRFPNGPLTESAHGERQRILSALR
jgi:hypothetical protein